MRSASLRVGDVPSSVDRRKTQARRLEPAQQHSALDDRRPGLDQIVAKLLGNVVVVTLKSATRNSVGLGKLMQLIQ